MTAIIDSPKQRGQFLDRFLAFFAGAAIAVWFLGGLSSSTTESASLAGPETQLVSALTSESTTILTRLSEEIIVQVASSFEAAPQNAPFATIGEDGQLKVLSLEVLTDHVSISASSSDQDEPSASALASKILGSQASQRVELVATAAKVKAGSFEIPSEAQDLDRLVPSKAHQTLAAKLSQGQTRDGPKRSTPLLA